ncbi:MAG: MBOAT family protein, partial [Gammaproteobacteria bacterium]|nr:MBOAT family protein [Gammaproteobacteria bacterium]
ADGVAQYATPVFSGALSGDPITFFVAWGGALAYTFQLYFDFSGYSDMAIGAARIFGIRLPLNFHSPYKSLSIVEFWRRWHMTLSRFLRDYLYIALGGNRHGAVRRYRNLILTMLLGGLWHGAGWTFVVWGALHGFYLCVNHLSQHLGLMAGLEKVLPRQLVRALSWGLTFFAVVVGWVFFRAENFDAAFAILSGMLGFNGVAIPHAIFLRLGALEPIFSALSIGTFSGGGRSFVTTYLWIALLLPIAVMAPNTQQLMRRFRPAFDHLKMFGSSGSAAVNDEPQRLVWRPSAKAAVLAGSVAAVGVLALTGISEFLYFQF